MHLNSDLLFRKYCLSYFQPDRKVLEIGPSGNPHERSYFCQLVDQSEIEWRTLSLVKLEGNATHIFAEREYDYPIEDEAFDIVFSAQVMEHVKEIWTWLDELKRITKPGGLIIIISPVSWSYHEAPVDCWRIYPEGMKALVHSRGMEILHNAFESLEKDKIPASTPTLPGDSAVDIRGLLGRKDRVKVFLNRLLAPVPFLRKLRCPVTVSYDNVCVMRKPVG